MRLVITILCLWVCTLQCLQAQIPTKGIGASATEVLSAYGTPLTRESKEGGLSITYAFKTPYINGTLGIQYIIFGFNDDQQVKSWMVVEDLSEANRWVKILNANYVKLSPNFWQDYTTDSIIKTSTEKGKFFIFCYKE